MDKFSNADIARYYDVSKTHYNKMWDLQRSKSLHYGIWDKTTRNFHEALLNTNKVLAAMAGITNSSLILDAGCGVGGSSLWLAKNIGCSATGISLSAQQVASAQTAAQHAGISHLAKFETNDFCNTGYPPQSFDVIWAVESVCHAHDKADFITEAYRLLKPGGRLVMADFFKADHLTGADAALIKRWANGWAIDDFSTYSNFSNQLGIAGFTLEKQEDATSKIIKSAKRLYYAYFPGIIGGFFYGLLHKNPTQFGKRNIDTALLQYKALKRQLWTYRLLCAVK